MKKVYEKPAAFIERFDLAQSIATGCSVLDTFGGSTVTNTDEKVCGFVFGGSVYFSDNVTDCTAGEFDEFCYNAPAEGMVLFAS